MSFFSLINFFSNIYIKTNKCSISKGPLIYISWISDVEGKGWLLSVTNVLAPLTPGLLNIFITLLLNYSYKGNKKPGTRMIGPVFIIPNTFDPFILIRAPMIKYNSLKYICIQIFNIGRTKALWPRKCTPKIDKPQM